MRKKRIIMYGCMAALAVSMMAGCGKGDSQSDGNNQAASEEQNQSGTRKEQGGPGEQDGSRMVQVTKVEGNNITAKVAEMPQGKEGAEKPDGTPPADGESREKPDGTPPADGGSGEKPDGTPPADGKKDRQGDGKGGRGGMNFQFSDETISFQVTSNTKITKGRRDSSEEASASDIQENSILRVVLDDSDQAESIQIMERNQ